MHLLDVSVVLAAFRADHPNHAVARAWLDRVLAAGDDFAVPLAVWASFLRLATSRRVFEVPTSPSDALAYVDAVRSQPGHVAAEPGPRHLELLARLCDEAGAAGDLVADAVVGAVALEHAATVVTFDRDFARFASVRHVRPGT